MKVWSSQPIRQCLALITGMGMALAAWANDISIMSCHLSARGGDRPGLYLNLNVEFDLPRSVQDALHRGIPLYFITEFSLEQKRWYWVDKDFAHASLTSRLSYSPLTRQYRLSRGGLSQSFDSATDALLILKSLHGWRVATEPGLENPEDFVAEVRVRLDTEQLPLPMQVTIGDNDWDLSSDWQPVDLQNATVKNTAATTP